VLDHVSRPARMNRGYSTNETCRDGISHRKEPDRLYLHAPLRTTPEVGGAAPQPSGGKHL